MEVLPMLNNMGIIYRKQKLELAMENLTLSPCLV